MSLIPIFPRRRFTSEVSLVDNSVDPVDRTTYPFSTQSLGVADVNRKIVIVASHTSSARVVASITVRGVSASQVVGVTDSVNSSIEIWEADVPSGTTGDVLVVYTNSVFRCGIGVFRLIAASALAYATASDIGSKSSFSGTVTIPSRGIAIAGCVGAEAGTQTPFAWTNLTEKYDEQVDAANAEHSGASDAFAARQTSRLITCTPNITGLGALVVASWGPKT